MKNERVPGKDEGYVEIQISRAPWGGEQFKRFFGSMKQSVYKVIGNTRKERATLDEKMCLFNRPMTCDNDDVQQPI